MFKKINTDLLFIFNTLTLMLIKNTEIKNEKKIPMLCFKIKLQK